MCAGESVRVQLGPILPVAVGPVFGDVAASAHFKQVVLSGDYAAVESL
jgi:hypothetical protein